MITANVMHRVFHIGYEDGTGTAFAISVDGREYLVTAKHVVAGMGDTGSLRLYSGGAWSTLPVRLVGHCEGEIDISVMSASSHLVSEGLPLVATFDDVVYGQDTYFLGFPYGMTGKVTLGPNGYPLPFVKRATLSMFNGPFDLFWLDGHNNPGFSGGPVVFKGLNDKAFKVAGVSPVTNKPQNPSF